MSDIYYPDNIPRMKTALKTYLPKGCKIIEHFLIDNIWAFFILTKDAQFKSYVINLDTKKHGFLE